MPVRGEEWEVFHEIENILAALVWPYVFFLP